MVSSWASVNGVGKNVNIFHHTNESENGMRRQHSVYLPTGTYSYYPTAAETTLVDGEPVHVGPVLLAIMRERGSTIKGTARDIGISPANISKFFRGEPQRIGPATIAQVMHACNISIQDIVDKARELRTLPSENLNQPDDSAMLQP